MNLANEILKTEYKREEIFSVLSGENEDIKPFALVYLDSINTQEEFDLFIFHLTNHDGRIREIVSSKFVELMPVEFCLMKNHKKTIVQGILDVNPNVARNIIEFLKVSKLNIKEEIYTAVEFIMGEIEKNSRPKKWRSQKNHILTKKYFNLYWLLEAISEGFEEIPTDEFLIKILEENSDNYDYTIREKVAKILVRMKNPPQELLQKMQNDDNYYVKLKFYDKI
jgi:hypothetical protein